MDLAINRDLDALDHQVTRLERSQYFGKLILVAHAKATIFIIGLYECTLKLIDHFKIRSRKMWLRGI